MMYPHKAEVRQELQGDYVAQQGNCGCPAVSKARLDGTEQPDLVEDGSALGRRLELGDL